MTNPHVIVPAPLRGTPADQIPKLEQWDPEGDIYLPPNAGAETYRPTIEAAPPQLPDVDHRLKPKDFEPYGVQPYWDTAAADHAATQLGFTAHAVLVDNYSACWLFFPDARTWIPPNTWHAILSLQGTQVASWQRMSPLGGAQPASTAPITTVWYEAALSPSNGSTVSLQPDETPLAPGDASGNTTGADVVVMAANPNRRYLLIQNISAGTIYVNFGAAASAAAGSYELLSGGTLVMESDFVATDAVHIFGAAGLAYTAKQG